MALTTLTSEATVEEVVQQLRQDGALIIKDIISPQMVDQLTAEVQPHIDATPAGRDDFAGRTTRRTGALAARSAICRDLIMHDLVLGCAQDYLQPFTRKIILHLTQTIDIGPGGAARRGAGRSGAGHPGSAWRYDRGGAGAACARATCAELSRGSLKFQS